MISRVIPTATVEYEILTLKAPDHSGALFVFQDFQMGMI